MAHIPPKVPSGFTVSARELWVRTTTEYELRAEELRVLADACHEAMLIDRLDKAIRSAKDLMAVGSMGQPVMHPAVAEIRQHRMALSRLLATLKLDAAGQPAATRSELARKAANAKWSSVGSKAS